MIDSLAAPGDVKATVAVASRALVRYYNRDFITVRTLPDLEAEEKKGRTVWVVTTLERIVADQDQALLDHIHTQYDRVRVLPGTLGDGQMRIYRRAPGASFDHRSKMSDIRRRVRRASSSSGTRP